MGTDGTGGGEERQQRDGGDTKRGWGVGEVGGEKGDEREKGEHKPTSPLSDAEVVSYAGSGRNAEVNR